MDTLLLVAALTFGAAAQPADRWESAIRDFEAKDRAQPPAQGGAVFVGSSSIRLWDLAKSFPGRRAINRGFGGSQLADAVRYADRIVIPYAPAVVVLYAGDNDLAAGKSPEQVSGDFRQFAAKVHCFEAGFRRIADSSFDIVGNLDADLTFEPGYLEYLLEQFARNPRLGVAGTPFVEEGSSYDYRFTNIEHVSGACQLFRRKCFEDIGGYRPIEGGGIDWVAVTSARMKGWQTRTFTDKVLVHHRKMGTGKGNRITALFRQGRQDYYLGNHPLWEFLRMFYQMRFRPAVVGGLTLFSGYCLAALARVKSPVPKDLAAFIRREQMQRLRSKLPIPGWKGRG